MKVHKQKKYIKPLALILATLMLTISMASTTPIQAHAAKTATVSSETLYDIALAKVGIHASNSLLSRLINSHINTVTGTAQSYWGYCKTEGLEKNAESWSAYVNSDSYATPVMRFASWIIQTEYFLKWCRNNDETDFLGSDLVNAVLGKDTALAGESYKLDDELVESIHDDFETFVETEGIGYYYVPIKDATYLNIDWFHDATHAENAKSIINESNDPICLCLNLYKGAVTYFDIYMDFSDMYLVVQDNPTSPYWFGIDWNIAYPYGFTMSGSNGLSIDYATREEFKENHPDNITRNYVLQLTERHFFAKEKGKMIIYESFAAFKEYTLGIRPYYMTTNNIYDNSVDNSVEVTGDYLVNNGGSLSYDTIYEQIIEGDDYSDNSVNEIVNSNNQTIINNYYYTEDSGDEGGEGGSGDGAGGGIGSLIGGIGDLLDFIVTLIGDLLSVLTGFLGTIYNMLKSVGGVFTNFSGLLGELFVFIPKELIDLLTAGIGAGIAIALWKMFRR